MHIIEPSSSTLYCKIALQKGTVMTKLEKWKITQSEYILTDQWIRLRADSCIAPDGARIEPFYVLEYADVVSCIVLSEDLQEVTMLQHYRHGVQDFVLEAPSGIIDKGETPEEAVARELREEIGLVGAAIHRTGTIWNNASMATNKIFCFVAIGGQQGPQQLEPGDTFSIVKMPFTELLTKIENPSNILQGSHVSATLFTLNFLKKQK